MPALSHDLRQRIVAHYNEGHSTYCEVAKLFKVGEASVSRLLRRYRERGDLSRDPGGGGFPARIPDSELPALKVLVAEKPDRILSELCAEWFARTGIRLSMATMHRSLGRAGITRKKSLSSRPNKTVKTSKKSAESSKKRSQK